MTRRSLGTAISAALLGCLLVASATQAAAPMTLVRNDRFSFSFTDDGLCPGVAVNVSFDVQATRTLYMTNDGTERELVVHVRYWGWFSNPTNGAAVATPGTRHIVFDFLRGLRTESGAYRVVTSNGSGVVLHETGRTVMPLDESAVLFEAGPKQELYGSFHGLCAALAGP